jgi:2,3-bisphosphoglycerate-dependent phosphoglycerate mutase
MNNDIIFLRHAATKKDKDISVSQWTLTDEGKKEVQELTDSGIFDDVDIIISSTEKKAYLTVEPLAKKLSKEITPIKELSEINRDSGKIMPKEEYDQMKVKIFEDFDYTNYGWETVNSALNRFKKAVEDIDQKYDGKKIIIASHGTVMTTYFSYLQNELDNVFKRWKSLGFLDYGIIKNGKVIKDIIE